MSFTHVRRAAGPIAAAATVAAGTLLMASPASAASSTVELQGACQARAVLAQHMSQPLGMSITAPDTAKVGEDFIYTLIPRVSCL